MRGTAWISRSDRRVSAPEQTVVECFPVERRSLVVDELSVMDEGDQTEGPPAVRACQDGDVVRADGI
jgi:hypothetical protein